MKLPQTALSLISRHLPRLAGNESSTDSRAPAEYSVDELARAGGTTVRNVRAYQDRGLLPPPIRRGRAGIYTETHLFRLRLIHQLLDRGYTIANIHELINAWEGGQDIEQLLGLEAALASPWSDESPVTLSLTELLAAFGDALTPNTIDAAIAFGLVEPEENGRFRVPSLRMLRAGGELIATGIPVPALFEHLSLLRGETERLADNFVRIVVEHLFDPIAKDEPPPASELPRLAELIWRIRPIAEVVVKAELARALERSAHKFLGDRLAHFVEVRQQGKPLDELHTGTPRVAAPAEPAPAAPRKTATKPRSTSKASTSKRATDTADVATSKPAPRRHSKATLSE